MNFANQFHDQLFPQSIRNGTGPQAALLDVRDFIARQWRVIALAVAFGVLLGAFYIAVSPTLYTAQADMLIDTKRVSWTQTEMATDTRTVEDASVDSEIETTKSERVAMMVIRRLNLTADPEFVGQHGLVRRVLALLHVSPAPSHPEPQLSEEELMRRALGVVKGNLRVLRLGRSYIEQIQFTSLNRDKAAKIANAFADAYIEDQLQAKYEATRRASEWLQQRIGELRKQASDAFKAVQDYKSDNGIIIGVDGKLASEVELDQLGAALAKARADTTQAKAKFDRISRVLEQRSDTGNFDIPDPVVTDALSNPVITRLRQQFLDDQNKESEWSSRYGPDHTAARNLRAEMAGLQRAIWDEVSRIAESYKSELQIAKSQEDAIDKRMKEVFQSSGSARQSQVHLRELETAANSYRGIYETFLSRFTQSVQQQSFPSTEARIVTFASPPFLPSSPKIALSIALAAVCGLGFGVVLAFGREQLSRHIHTRAQIEELLNTSCLAVLPLFRNDKGFWAVPGRRTARRRSVTSRCRSIFCNRRGAAIYQGRHRSAPDRRKDHRIDLRPPRRRKDHRGDQLRGLRRQKRRPDAFDRCRPAKSLDDQNARLFECARAAELVADRPSSPNSSSPTRNSCSISFQPRPASGPPTAPIFYRRRSSRIR